jgi:hypothetical protein
MGPRSRIPHNTSDPASPEVISPPPLTEAIVGAFHPALREPVTIVAAVEKIAFGLGIFGTPLRRHPIAAGIAVGDILIPLVYVLYLVGF